MSQIDSASLRSINYFFVFQNKSFREESKLQYLWAPKTNALGHNVSHWTMVSNIKKGDIVIHSYKQKIVAISRALTDCYSANIPIEKGDSWNVDGWRVESEYFIFKNPIKSKDIRESIVQLQPKNNAPFDRFGSGNMGYMFSANYDLFDFIIRETRSQMSSKESKRLDIFLTSIEPGVDNSIEQLLDVEMNDEVDIALEFMPKTREIEFLPKNRTEPVFIQGKKAYPRNRFAAANSLIRADYKCEIDSDHSSFIRRSTKKNYTEPHHLVPMSAQMSYEKSLDTEANIISLCSNCHNQIHYGVGSEILIEKLYKMRKDELEKTGIFISLEELLEIYSEN